MASVTAMVDLRGTEEFKALEEENRILREAIVAGNIASFSLGPPNSGVPMLCMICAEEKPWGVWSPTGSAVCRECRDKARA